MKKIISLLISCIVILSSISIIAYAEDDFTVLLTYSDIQDNKTSYDLRYGTNTNHIESQQLPSYNGGSIVYLAKNEYEGFQLYYYEKSEGRNISISSTPFVNSEGQVLDSAIYREEYFTSNVNSSILAEALIPYGGEAVETVQNESNMFYIELKSDKEQTSGDYTSTITVSDESGIISSKKITARVWNFALPEGHLSTYLCGLYTSASGYATTDGFLRLSGVRMQSNGKPVEEDRELAKTILKSYDEFLLQHGINSYEIPAFYIEDDSKEAELMMADTRRSMFMIPVEGNITSAANTSTINAYKNIVADNKELSHKAFFYPADEPNWSSDSDTASFDNTINSIKSIWGDNYHAIVPFYGTNNIDYKINKLKETTDIYCPNQGSAAGSETVRNSFSDSSWHKTLRYQGDTWLGNTYFVTSGKSTKGVFARALQWQAAALNSDGMLHWNCGFVPKDSEGNAYDVFENNRMPSNVAPSTGNGDGIFIYSGASLGLDPETPVASLRLKQISSGMDDYDYLMMIKEFIGEDAYETYLNSFLGSYKTSGITNIWSSHAGAFIDWECVTINSIRIRMGNALSSASTEHSYGDWETAVEGDDTHNGLSIRTCQECGAKESKNIGSLCNHKEYISSEAVNPTCSTEGKTAEKSCSICKEVTQQSLKISATPHKTEKFEGKPSSCTEEGYADYEKCLNCDYTTFTIISKAEHTADDGVITKKASCTETGVITYSCSVCGEFMYSDTIPVTEHIYKLTASKLPTCTKDGSYIYTCDTCGAEKSDAIPSKGHTAVTDKAKEASCTETGLTEGSHCSVCNEILTKQDTIPTKEHTDKNNDDYCDICNVRIGRISDEEFLDNVIIRTPSSTAVLWKTNTSFRAAALNVPEGYELAVYVGNKTYKAKPDSSGKCEITVSCGEMTADANVTVRIEKNGVTASNTKGILEKSFTIKVKNSFGDKISAFFKYFFNLFKRPSTTIDYN